VPVSCYAAADHIEMHHKRVKTFRIIKSWWLFMVIPTTKPFTC